MRAVAALVSLAFIAAPLAGQVITPHGDFGPQPTMTFGGSGIPTDWVLTNSNAGQVGVTLALTAHQRYDNPALTNDGAGTFQAGSGIDTNAPSPGDPYALWNWGWYVGGTNLSSFGYRFYYDFNPAVGNDRSDHGLVEWGVGMVTGVQQNSWNNGMDFLTLDFSVPGVITWTSPSFGAFDPSVSGEYTYLLEMFSDNGVIGSVGMAVRVGDISTVPEPATMTLLATGLAGMAAARRKRRS